MVLVLLIIPTLITQGTALVAAAPEYLKQLRDWLIERFPDLMVEDSAIRVQLNNIEPNICKQRVSKRKFQCRSTYSCLAASMTTLTGLEYSSTAPN